MALLLTGCHHLGDHDLLGGPAPPVANPAAAPPGERLKESVMLPNPLPVPVASQTFFWNQLVDTVDDYFDIASEQPIHSLGSTFTEGRIETTPQSAATLFEPWHWDSTPGFEKWHASLQSIRRRARIRAIPQGNSAFVEVIVEKAIEDVDVPAQGTPGSAIPRHDSALVRMRDYEDRQTKTLGWIPIGRDYSLEQEILRQLNSRLIQSQ